MPTDKESWMIYAKGEGISEDKAKEYWNIAKEEGGKDWEKVMGIFKKIIANSKKSKKEKEDKDDEKIKSFIGYAEKEGVKEDQAKAIFYSVRGALGKKEDQDVENLGPEQMAELWKNYKEAIKDAKKKEEKQIVTSKPYLIENKIIKSKASITIIQEGLINIPSALNNIASILGKRLGIKIGIVPIEYSSSLGGVSYVAILDDPETCVTLEFSGNNLSRIGRLDDLDNKVVAEYIDLQGYNIVQILDEIEDILDNYLSYGKFISSLEESTIKEARPSNDSLEAWIKTIGKNAAEDILVNQKMKDAYAKYVAPWVEENGLPEMSFPTFYNKAKAYLASKKLENIYARKTVIINKAGKVEMVEDKSEEKTWQAMLTNTYKLQLEGMEVALRNVVLGAYNSVYITGSPGSGKTTRTKQILDGMNVNYLWVSGLVKDLESLVNILYANKDDAILVFDDTSLLKNKSFRELLLAILDDKEVRTISYYEKKNLNRQKRNKIPEQFEFTSGVIFIGNDDPKRVDPAIRSRTSIVPVELSKDEMMSMIYDNLDTFMPNVPRDVKQYVFEWLVESLGEFNRIDFRMMKTAVGFLLGCRNAGDNSNKWEIYARNALGLGSK